MYYLLLGKLTIKAILQNKWKKWIALNMIKIGSELTLLSVFLAKIKRKKLLIAFPVAELVYIPYFLFLPSRAHSEITNGNRKANL